MIELNGLTKRYGPTLAVDDLSIRVQPGKVTGFLGPNGAGKSTSMRMVLGLDRPTAGQALVDGRPYQELRAPLRVVGALLDAGRSIRPAAPATTCSPWPAATGSEVPSRGGPRHGRPGQGRRTAGRSVLAGDASAAGDRRRPARRPRHRPVRRARQRAGPRRHPLGPPAPLGQVIAGSSHTVVRVRTPAAAQLGRLLAPTAQTVRQESDSVLTVVGLTTDDVGEVAHATGTRLHELTLQSASLEQAYMELSQHHLDYGASQLAPQGA